MRYLAVSLIITGFCFTSPFSQAPKKSRSVLQEQRKSLMLYDNHASDHVDAVWRLLNRTLMEFC